MKKIIKILVSFLLIISIALCVYQIYLRVSSCNIINKNDIQISGAANCLAALKHDINGNESGVISDNVKVESNNMDNKQLNVSSIKKIMLKSKEKIVYGLYLKDSIITSDDYASNTLRITNIITGNTRTNEYPGKVIDYADSTVMLLNDSGYYIYNVEQGRGGKIPSGKTMIPVFIDYEGNFILTDDGKNYCIYNRNTEDVYKLPLNMHNNNYKCKAGPCVTLSDKKDSIYYDDGPRIFSCSIRNSQNVKEVLDISDYCTEIKSMEKIKGENAVVVSCLDRNDNISCKYVNLLTGEVKDILTPVNYRYPNYKIKGNKVCTINRIVYEEKTKNDEFRICIGEIKKGNLIKTTDVVKVKYADSRDLVWSGYWNDDATRLYLSLYSTNSASRKDYVVNIN